MSSSARQPRGVQRAGAAERHQRIVARIVAALHRDHPDRPRHVGGDHRDDALRRRHQAEAERRGEPRDRCQREIPPDRHAPAQQMRRIERLQHDVGVGHRRFVVAAAVADRPGSAPALRGPTFSSPPLSM